MTNYTNMFACDYSPDRPRLEPGDVVTVWVARDGTYAQLHYRKFTMQLAQVIIGTDGDVRRVLEHHQWSKTAHGSTWMECAVRFARDNALIGRITVKAHQDESYDQHETI